MHNLNHPSNELYQTEPSWIDRCDKPNWVVVYLSVVMFLFGSIAGIGFAYLILN